MSRCAGTGGEHSQTDSPSWPIEIFHTIDILLSLQMGIDLGAGIVFFNALFPGVRTLSGVWSFFGSSAKLVKFWEFDVLRSVLKDWLCNWLSEGKKKIVLCIVCFAYSVAVVFSFVVLSNFLYLNPQVLFFVHCPPHLITAESGEVSKWLSGPSCQLPG